MVYNRTIGESSCSSAAPVLDSTEAVSWRTMFHIEVPNTNAKNHTIYPYIKTLNQIMREETINTSSPIKAKVHLALMTPTGQKTNLPSFAFKTQVQTKNKRGLTYVNHIFKFANEFRQTWRCFASPSKQKNTLIKGGAWTKRAGLSNEGGTGYR